MATGLRVEIVNREDGSPVRDALFHDFPVRIGRIGIAEISLPYDFISGWHAILNLDGDAVQLWDLGSRNGTTVGSPLGKLPPHEKVDLRQHGLTFSIGPLRFTIEVVDAERRPVARERGGPMLSSTSGKLPGGNGGPPAIAMSADAGLLAEELIGDYGRYRAGWGPYYEKLVARLEALDPSNRRQVVRLLAAEFPTLAGEPDFQRLVSSLGLSLADVRPLDALRDEDVALEVLKELADWYHTPHELAGREAIVGFAQKIQDALDALFAGYIPLRDGLKSIVTRLAVNPGQPPSQGSSGVAHVESQLQVGTRVLDWTDPTDAAHAFRRLFADLMVHDMSLLSGVMKGAGRLVSEFSPEALTRAFEEARRARNTGVTFGPYRYRELWRALERRHRDFTTEEDGTFALLFGHEFAAMYEQFSSAAAAGTRVERRPPRPPSRPAPSPAPSPAQRRAPARTPEEPRPQGPTGTVVVPRVPPPAPRNERS